MPAAARAIATLAAIMLAACEAPTTEPAQVPGAAAAAEYLRGSDWPSYNRDLGGTRYSPLNEITVTNVDELRQAWSYPLGDRKSTRLNSSHMVQSRMPSSA